MKARLAVGALLAGLVLASAGLSAFLFLHLAGNVRGAPGTDVGFDVVSTGNTATALSSIERCRQASPGEQFTVDVFIDEIPAGRDIAGFQYQIVFDDSRVRIVTQDHSFLLANAAGSAVSDLSNPVPDDVSPHASIVVDFGTATVFDAISQDGEYLGGAIAPGISVAADALFLSTSQLRRVELESPKSAIGRNTVASIQSGLILGYVGLVEGMVKRFKEELGGEVKVVATGGMAGLIAAQTQIFDDVNEDLTLIGLRMIHEMNCDQIQGGE